MNKYLINVLREEIAQHMKHEDSSFIESLLEEIHEAAIADRALDTDAQQEAALQYATAQVNEAWEDLKRWSTTFVRQP